jgi:D-aminoacyl-tRNA deacylase
MRAVIQRVKQASVIVNDHQTAAIGKGVVVFIGIGQDDTSKEINWIVEKIVNLRIFPDSEGKMNLSLSDIDAEVLIVSQFTLYGDCRKGRRPGFSGAAAPGIAEPLYNQMISEMQKRGITTATGIFQTMMDISLTNDGPVTLLLDSDKLF